MSALAKVIEPRWERRKDARPGELSSAALELFVERGFAATRLDDVAKRAGLENQDLQISGAAETRGSRAKIVSFSGEVGEHRQRARDPLRSGWGRFQHCADCLHSAAGLDNFLGSPHGG